TVLQDGGMIEVATIGREGMVGVSAVLDGGRVPSCSMVQAEMATCHRMTVDALRRETDRHGALYDLLTHYSQALMGFVMQSTACNAVHTVEQRLARWLLLAQDRVGRDEFLLTQEFVAMMLGAARPTVTVVAGTLQKAGLIKYRHGHVTIVDRKALEEASCECYVAATALLEAVTDGCRASRARRVSASPGIPGAPRRRPPPPGSSPRTRAPRRSFSGAREAEADSHRVSSTATRKRTD